MRGIQDALNYIEDNITDKLEIQDIAAQAYISAFHFQRIFSVLCGMTVGEYIRCRRLTLAAQELSCPDPADTYSEIWIPIKRAE